MGKINFWVTMTDKALSGWGRADGKIAKFVYECETIQEAEAVEEYANRRSDQKHVNIRASKPYYKGDGFLVQWKNKEDSPRWYGEGK